jgi:hypothetical protein
MAESTTNSTTNSRFAAEEALVQTMWEFRHARAPIIEKEYYETHGDAGNQRMRNELYDRILRLLGANKGLFIDFSDRDAACHTNLPLKECLNEKCTVAKIQGNSTFFIRHSKYHSGVFIHCLYHTNSRLNITAIPQKNEKN